MQIEFTRKVDELGRIVLPMDVRKHMGFEKDQILEITIQEDAILLRKAGVTCALCGGSELVHARGPYLICDPCYEKITMTQRP